MPLCCCENSKVGKFCCPIYRVEFGGKKLESKKVNINSKGCFFAINKKYHK